MARSKPYTIGLGILDVCLTLLTSGFYLLIVLIRELYRRSANRTKPYTIGLGIMDGLLCLFTGGFWLIVMLPRELYRRK